MIPRYTLPKMGRIWSDENRFGKMLQVELLVCEAKARLGQIPQSALEQIKKKARFSLKRTRQIETKVHHDVIAFLTNVAEEVGRASRFIHQGLTSYDVVDTALAVMMREAEDILIEDLKSLSKVLKKKAKRYKHTICIGRSHGIHAEPTTFGLKMALFYEEMARNLRRMGQVRRVTSVGKVSGAVGTFAHIEPFVEEYVCKKLGLARASVSTQILQRDRHAQYITTLAIIGSSLEKLATEIRGLQRTEIREVEEPFAKGQKGSSAMPHKRNPVICEQMTGLARILRANALAAMENIALWHERDISHSSAERIILPDSSILLDYMLNKMTRVIEGLAVYPENMRQNLEKTKGLIFSEKVMLELIKKGSSREEAYVIVQKNAMKVWDGKVDFFKEALVKDNKVTEFLSGEEIESCFDLNYFTRNVDGIFKKIKI